jgi:cupin superfamily acireductone dioxygenase involved in methionine salvage
MKWKERIKIGDLVRFNDDKRAKYAEATSEYAKEHLRHIFEIGLVVAAHGLDPIIAFPSKTGSFATANLVVL